MKQSASNHGICLYCIPSGIQNFTSLGAANSITLLWGEFTYKKFENHWFANLIHSKDV